MDRSLKRLGFCGMQCQNGRSNFGEVMSDLTNDHSNILAQFPAWTGGDDNGHNDGNSEGGDPREQRENGVMLKTRPKTKKPSMYKVLLLNDDFTPMEFVVHILEKFFNKNRQEATDVMLHVHRRGVGVCGIFTYEVAESKVQQVMDFARANEQPLQCTLEKE